MPPWNPDGLYAVTQSVYNYDASYLYRREDAEAQDLWEFTADDSCTGCVPNPEGWNGETFRFGIPWGPGANAAGSEYFPAVTGQDDRNVGISGVTFEATATGGDELNAYLRQPDYLGDNTEAAGKVIAESFGGIARHNYGTEDGFPSIYPSNKMKFAGWA